MEYVDAYSVFFLFVSVYECGFLASKITLLYFPSELMKESSKFF